MTEIRDILHRIGIDLARLWAWVRNYPRTAVVFM